MSADDWPYIRHWRNAVVVLNEIANSQDLLLPEEQGLELGTTPARQRELRAGRTESRLALRTLSLTPSPILMSSNGAPLWPIGISGSIAHSHVHIAVISARVQDYRSLGIDIDDGRDLEGAVVDIATAPELQRVMEAYSVDVNAAARLAFSAKEALFKCQAPITSMESLVFLDVALQPRVDGSMAALLQVPIEPQAAVAISAISIFFECFQGVRLAIATLPPA